MELYSYFFILGIGLLAWVYGKLTFAASVAGSLLAMLLFNQTGIAGIWFLGAFFVMAVFATKTAGKAGEQRDTGQVIANGGMAAILCLVYFFCKDFPLLILLAACFSSAAADTVSSELGTLWGSNFYNINNFRRGRKGNNGVVSIEGSAMGLVASTLIAFIYVLLCNNMWHAAIIVIAGTVGNYSDSILGHFFENKGWMSNNWVNFLNTAIAAGVAWLLWLI